MSSSLFWSLLNKLSHTSKPRLRAMFVSRYHLVSTAGRELRCYMQSWVTFDTFAGWVACDRAPRLLQWFRLRWVEVPQALEHGIHGWRPQIAAHVSTIALLQAAPQLPMWILGSTTRSKVVLRLHGDVEGICFAQSNQHYQFCLESVPESELHTS